MTETSSSPAADWTGEPVAPGAKRPAVIMDADGTLCDVRSVQHFVSNPDGTKAKKPNFHKFHAGSANCPPHEEVAGLARRAHESGMGVVVVTGREARWRDMTAKWLKKNGIPYDALITRGSNDYRPDHVVKTELLQRVQRSFRPVLAVDDRPDIIKVWHDAGIPAVQVDKEGALGPVDTPAGATLDPKAAALLA